MVTGSRNQEHVFAFSLAGGWSRAVRALLQCAIITWLGCACRHESALTFQDFEAGSTVNLQGVLAEIPAIDSLFQDVDAGQLGDLATNSSGSVTQAEALATFNAFARLGESANGPYPELINKLSGGLHAAYVTGSSRIDRFNNGFTAVDSLLATTRPALAGILSPLAKVLQFTANNTSLYPDAVTYSFPSQSTWSDCTQNSSRYYDARVTALNPTGESSRESLLSMYTLLREIRCGVTGSILNVGDTTGEVLYNYLSAHRSDTPDIEQITLTDIAYIRNNTDALMKSDEDLAQWLITDPDKVAFTDYVTRDLVTLLQQDVFFDELQPRLDVTASFLTQKNIPDGEYLLSDILYNFSNDYVKFADADTLLKNASQKTPLWGFTQKLIDDPGFGLNATIARYGGGDFNAGKDKLLAMLWDGTTYTTNIYRNNACTGSNCVTMYSAGLLNVPAESPATTRRVSKEYIAYRLQMHDILNGNQNGKYYGQYFDNDSGDGDPLNPTSGMGIKIPPTYYGETLFESFLTNIGLYLTERYYSRSTGHWSFSQADGTALFADSSRHIERYLSQLQYLLRSAAILDSSGKQPGDAGFAARNPLITDFFYFIGVGSGFVDKWFNTNLSTVQAGLRLVDASFKNNQGDSTNVAGTGVSVSQQNFLGYGVAYVSLPFFCAGDNCTTIYTGKFQTTWRNGYAWRTNVSGFAGEMFTPGKFIPRRNSGGNTSGTYEIWNGTSWGSMAGSFRDNTYLHGAYVGSFSSHQGDIENANYTIGQMLIPSMLMLCIWDGYGPFTYRGHAPNGSRLKYENDFYTDAYRTQLYVSHSLAGTKETVISALGNNTGIVGAGKITNGDWNSNIIQGSSGKYLIRANSAGTASDPKFGGNIAAVASAANAQGNLHIYEKIYRPQKTSDPCFAEATVGGAYPYARYGFIRPSLDNGYANNANCTNWEKVQVDFDNREEAIKANALWTIYDKKIVIIVPQSAGDTSVWGFVAAMAAWVVQQANGLQGLLRLRPVQDISNSTVNNRPVMVNGGWNFFSKWPVPDYPNQICNPLAIIGNDGTHQIHQKCPYGTHYTNSNIKVTVVQQDTRWHIHPTLGTINETPVGATVTHRWNKTSFEPGDSGVSVLYTISASGGLATSSNLGTLEEGIFEGLGIIPAQAPLAFDNLRALETLFAQYQAAEMIAPGAVPGSNSFAKFRQFYDRYFSTDDHDAAGNPGSDGILDMWQKYQRSQVYPSCRDTYGQPVQFCLTAEQLPYLPRVQGVSYPASYDAFGNPQSWSVYSGSSELKAEAVLPILANLWGAQHDAQEKYVADTPSTTCGFSGGPTDQQLVSGCRTMQTDENVDKVVVKGLFRNDYRDPSVQISQKPAIALLNESTRTPALPPVGCLQDYNCNPNFYPATYNPQALTNALLETSQGKRDGLLPKLVTSDYLHLHSLEQAIGTYVHATFNQMPTFDNTPSGASPANLTKLAYFTTGSTAGAGKPLASNYLQSLGGEPFAMLKNLVGYLRAATTNPKVVSSLKETIKAVNKLYDINKSMSHIGMTDAAVDGIVELINRKSPSSTYLVDDFADAITSSIGSKSILQGSPAIATATTSLHDLKTSFDAMNVAVVDIFGATYDLRKLILYGRFIDEPYYDANNNGVFDAGEPYLDYNTNGKFDAGAFAGSKYYADPLYDITDTNGLYLVHTKCPDFLEILNFIFSAKPTAKDAPPAPALTRDKVVSVINDITTFKIHKTLVEDTVATALDTTIVDEAGRDIDGNGTIDAGEYYDYNGNGAYDVAAATLRDELRYNGQSFQSSYQGVAAPGTRNADYEYLQQFSDTLLNPQCADYSDLSVCNPGNPSYVTAELFSARKQLFQSLKFKPEALHDLKETIGTLLYDPGQDRYTYFFAGLRIGMVPVNQVNLGYLDYDRQSTISLLAPGGAGRYLLSRLRLGQGFGWFDVERDVNTLLNIRVLRDYRSSDSFWYQASIILSDLSRLGYQQYSGTGFVATSLLGIFR